MKVRQLPKYKFHVKIIFYITRIKSGSHFQTENNFTKQINVNYIKHCDYLNPDGKTVNKR